MSTMVSRHLARPERHTPLPRGWIGAVMTVIVVALLESAPLIRVAHPVAARGLAEAAAPARIGGGWYVRA